MDAAHVGNDLVQIAEDDVGEGLQGVAHVRIVGACQPLRRGRQPRFAGRQQRLQVAPCRLMPSAP